MDHKSVSKEMKMKASDHDHTLRKTKQDGEINKDF